MMNDQERLERLLRARRPLIWVPTFEEDYALQLARDAALNQNRACWLWTHSFGLREGLLGSSQPIVGTDEPLVLLRTIIDRPDPAIYVALDLVCHLKNARVLRWLRHTVQRFAQNGSSLILIDSGDDLPAVLQAYVSRFDPSLPDAAEIETLVKAALRRENQDRPIEIAISRGIWEAIVRNLRGLTRRQIEQIVLDTVNEDRRFDDEDINHVLAGKRQALQAGGLLEYVETPATLDQVGGLNALKQWLAVRAGSLSSQGAEYGLPNPRGVLMLGVQGAGKSLCAKAVATAWQRPLMRMDVGALYDRYVGESERRLREALRQTEMMAPVILWIDEIEKAFASAASQSTDGGLSKRMFGTLLTWMQEHQAPVFLVATANDIEALPPELLRKGRFDEIFFVDLPPAETRREIFAIHLRKRGRDPGCFDLDQLVDASERYSGAEIEQAIVSGLYRAFADGRELDTATLLAALTGSPPLSETMRERVDALRRWARGRCVPAD